MILTEVFRHTADMLRFLVLATFAAVGKKMTAHITL